MNTMRKLGAALVLTLVAAAATLLTPDPAAAMINEEFKSACEWAGGTYTFVFPVDHCVFDDGTHIWDI